MLGPEIHIGATKCDGKSTPGCCIDTAVVIYADIYVTTVTSFVAGLRLREFIFTSSRAHPHRIPPPTCPAAWGMVNMITKQQKDLYLY